MQLGSSFFFLKKNIFLFPKKLRLDSCFFGKAAHSLTNVDAEMLTVKCLTHACIACGNHLMSLLSLCS